MELENVCSYCGNSNSETRDHVPSRVLLDEPFPENLPVVPCCEKCNQSFSIDEQYFACLIECIICGTTNIENINREKIKRILTENVKLKNRLELSKSENDGNVSFKIEEDRVRNVLIKLAKGHVNFEFSELIIAEPSSIWMKPLNILTMEEEDYFFTQMKIDKFPEVGSRGLITIIEEGHVNSPWITVQPYNYYYMVNCNSCITVRIIIQEYLAVEVKWSNNV